MVLLLYFALFETSSFPRLIWPKNYWLQNNRSLAKNLTQSRKGAKGFPGGLAPLRESFGSSLPN
jgi:hypothetical protein